MKKKRINFNWKFWCGDVLNGEEIKFNDVNWLEINIPHDWSIKEPVSKLNASSTDYEYEHQKDGKAERNGFFPAGIGWYRKRFNLIKENKDKKIFIEFEGIFRNSDVWINEHFLGNHRSGYTGFRYEITNYVNFGQENILVVRVDARKKEGWWYEGCGIYRNVWLFIANKLHISYQGIFATTPEVSEKNALVNIKTEVENKSEKEKDCILVTQILDKDNKIAGIAEAKQNISKNGRYQFSQKVRIKNPHLWSPENPYLYRVISTLKVNNKKVDSGETPLGIRTFRFDADNGFFLNGKNLKLRGMCGHQDCGPLGVALPDRVIFETMKLLKECGCNFYRSSHNPPTPALLDACDELGIMVWDENRHLDDSEQGINDLKSMLRKDRNHPCVIIWSLENEEGREGTIEGTKILKNLVQIAHKEDPTRPTTFAANHNVNPYGYADAVDVVSYNYFLDRADSDHKKYPKRKIGLISEYSAGISLPFAYKDNRDKRMENFAFALGTMYDLCKGNEICWTAINEKDWLSGGCLWNAFDYLGESPGWPMIAIQQGILDLCRFPKDNYYYYQSIWTKEPMLHILPSHWNWKEGEMVDVWIYTNCDNVELFLNNKSLGEKNRVEAKSYGVVKNLWMIPYHEEPVSDAHLSWEVPFKSGILKAIGKKNGKIVCTKEIHTAKDPFRIILTPLWNKIRSDGQDVCFIKTTVIDKKNNLVPNADNPITFHLEGKGEIIAVGNANPFSHESFKSNQRNCFNGVCLVVVQSTTRPGKIKVIANSPGLISGEAVIQKI